MSVRSACSLVANGDTMTQGGSLQDFVEFATELLDTNGYHSPTSNPQLITVPCTAPYLLFSYLGWPQDAANPSRSQNIQIVGTGTSPGDAASISSVGYLASGIDGIGGWGLVAADAGDAFRLRGGMSGNSPDTVDARMSCVQLDAAVNLLCSAFATGVSVPNGAAAAISLGSETIDASGMHSTSSNQSRIVVPATGNYLILHYDLWAGTSPGGFKGSAELFKNGSVIGTASAKVGQDAANRSVTGMLITPLTASDYIEIFASHDRGSAITSCEFILAVIALGSEDCACAYNTADIAMSASTWTSLGWNAETVDTNSFHDNSTNNSRMTIPVDGDYIVYSNVNFSLGGTSNNGMRVKQNGSVVGIPEYQTHALSPGGHSIAYVLSCVAGDYLEVEAWATNPSAGVLAGSNMGITRVPASQNCQHTSQIYRRLIAA